MSAIPAGQVDQTSFLIVPGYGGGPFVMEALLVAALPITGRYCDITHYQTAGKFFPFSTVGAPSKRVCPASGGDRSGRGTNLALWSLARDCEDCVSVTCTHVLAAAIS